MERPAWSRWKRDRSDSGGRNRSLASGGSYHPGHWSAIWQALAIPAAVLLLIAGTAYVITSSRVGPTVVTVTTGVGLHALDIVILMLVLPLIVALLRRYRDG
ncbi:MAG: hypothetical protein ACR2LS_09470 [Thermomicrobiales bacterium]